MTTFCQQLRLLLWKNYLLRRRNKIRMLIEIIWPLVLFLILVWVRTRGLKTKESTCHLAPKPLPSVGGFEFIQRTLCSLNNSCFQRFVEEDNNLYRNSGINRMVTESTPIILQILRNNNSLSTVNQLWRNINSFVALTNGIRSRADMNKIGQIKVQDLMSDEGKQSFLLIAPLYLGITDEEMDGLFNTVIHLDALNSDSLNAFMDQIRRGDCGTNTTSMELFTFPSPSIYETLCKLGIERSFILENIFNTFMSGNGVAKQIRSGMIADELEDFSPTGPYDDQVLSSFYQLAQIFARDAINVSDFINSTVPISGSDTAQFYKFVCGSAAGDSNTTMFGLVPDQANRYDTLRDNLMQWHSENQYEPDPNISAVCNTIFLRFEATPLSSLLWRQVKPFIRGSIFYAPNTNYTRKIMEKVEQKFSALKESEAVVNGFVNIVHRIRYWMRNNTSEVETIQEMAADKKFVEMIVNMLGPGIKPKDKEQLIRMLSWISQQDIAKTLERLDLVAEVVSELIGCIRYNKTKAFETEEEAVKAALPLLPLNSLWAVVVFPGIDTDPPPSHIHVKIRMDSDKVDGTRAIRDRLTSKTPRRRPIFDLKYITHGFVYLQEFIEQSIIEIKTGKSMEGTSLYLQQIPFPCYIIDQFVRAISRTFPLFMVLSWVYASAMIIKSIVYEKEKRLREIMKVMGLGNMVIWTGWFIDSFAVLSVSATVLSCILKWGKVIEKADFSLILVFMQSFTVSAICFSFLISTFFNRANSAAAAGGVIFFILYLPYNLLLIWEDHLTWYHIFSGCLISNVAFGFGCTYFARLEEDGLGAQWSRITLSTLPNDDFNLSYCLIMLWVDSILYILLALYIEAISPGSYGTPRPWYFIFQTSTYCSTPNRKKDLPRMNRGVSVDSEGADILVDAEPEGLTCGVVVTNLCKTYSNGKVALRNLNLNFYENQITSFLGHNGAGKTTTISILTGLYPPTTGTAFIYGNNIKTNMDRIRKDIGICPQFDVLFERLTVEDHMKFYAGLKGNDKEGLNEEINKMLVDLGIPQKREEFPGNLSGGMKRKLSVAIAFIGGSKTVFLDEPTSGVDPYSRRSIWELLLKYKEGRTIILTTHFMDEADLLGDRIAIISQGKLKTCGSSLFLKNQFGQGYSLTLVRKEERKADAADGKANTADLEAEAADGKSAWISGDVNVNGVSSSGALWEASEGNRSNNSEAARTLYRKPTSLLKSFVEFRIPEAILVDDVGTEVVFLLPYSESSTFPKLFNDLDSNLITLGISSYGISDTTLEEIFLRITVEDIQDPDAHLKRSIKRRMLGMCCFCCQNPVETTKVEDIDGVRANGIFAPQSTPAQNHADDNVTEDLVPMNNPSELSTGPESVALLESGYEIPQRSETQKTKKRNCFRLYLIQVCAIMKKRARNSSRNLKAMFFEIILPAVFIGLTLTFTLILPKPNDEGILELTPFHYGAPNNVFFSDLTSQPNSSSGSDSDWSSSFSNDLNITLTNSSVEEDLPYFPGLIKELTGPIGLGTECMDVNIERGVCHRAKWSADYVALFHKNRTAFTSADAKLGNCSCASGTQSCPSNVQPKSPPRLHTQTNDYILDTSKFFLPEWIQKTYNLYDGHRWGGYQFEEKSTYGVNLTYYLSLLEALTTLNTFPDVPKFEPLKTNATKIWFENRGWITSVSYLNALHNMILRQNLPDELQDQKKSFGITLYTHPLNLTKSQLNKENLRVSAMGVIHAICIIFALSFIPASFTVYLIDERQCGGKHLHLVSGVKPITYWTANFIYDTSKYFIPIALSLLLFIAFDAKAYISRVSIWAFLLLLLLYGWASIPLMYPASYLFKIPSTAFVVLACANLFIGVITTVSTFVLEQFGETDPELEEIGIMLKKLFLICPQYCLGRGLIELVRLNIFSSAQDNFNIAHREVDRFKWECLGKMHFFLFIEGIAFFILNLLIDYKQVFLLPFKRKRKHVKDTFDDEDEDVHEERLRVQSQVDKNSTLFTENLTKFYSRKKHPSVNSLCFTIGKGECFGLLGVNGAGKTSTFKMLTGDVRISSGKARITGYDVELDRDQARQHFGYCPQEDGFDSLLNGYEILELYGRLRGMGVKETKEASLLLVQTLGLSAHAYRRAGTYSGGNKRKLSTAIALIGDPDIIFLDEPTSGMDPGARRQLWKIIIRLIHMEKSVVLTSHSMEECEALCTRLGLMVNGQFVCLGSIQHLKNRFGKGYMLNVRCEAEKEKGFVEYMRANLPSAILVDSHCTQLKFSIPQDKAKLSVIFENIHIAKRNNLIEDYSLSQTTLDDIFVKFASNQRDALDR